MADIMELEGTGNGQLQSNKPRRVRRVWTCETGFEAEYPSVLWPENAVHRDEAGNLYVDFNEWPADAPSVEVSDQIKPYIPFPWDNPVVQKAQRKKTLQADINGLAAIEAVPFFIYTPTLYMMLNGTPVGSTQRVPNPPVVSTLDVMICYHLVETLFTTNENKEDRARIQAAQVQFKASLDRLKISVKHALEDLPCGNEYVKTLHSRAKEHGLEALASMDDDKEIITLIARIYVSYTLLYIHALEMFLLRLLCPQVDTRSVDALYLTASVLPSAHPEAAFQELIASLEPGLIEESLVVLRTRANHFKVPVRPTELTLEPRVCGLPVHFFRLLFLILTH